jgi:hypothetical protein
MEPDCSLSHSQFPATCLYPEPAESSPYPHIPLPEDPFYYYPPIYFSVSLVASFMLSRVIKIKLHSTLTLPVTRMGVKRGVLCVVET